MLEQLELRRLMDGRMSVGLDDGVLRIVGDDHANAIVIARNSDRPPIDGIDLIVTGLNGTTIAGVRNVTLTGVRRIDLIDLGDGDDHLTLSGLKLRGSTRIDAGAGNDQILLSHVQFSGDLVIDASSGDDDVIVRDTIVRRTLALVGGGGRDRLTLSRIAVKNDFALSDASGPTGATLNRLSVRGRGDVRTADSVDAVTIDSSTFFDDATVITAAGDDRVRVRGTVFHAASKIDPGPGGDGQVDREVILGWDFNNGSQGWEGGFSDYPAGQIVGEDVDGNPLTAEQAARLESGIRPLPSTLLESGQGFYIGGTNTSDDLYMYLVRRLWPDDGVVPGVPYLLSFDIVYATELPKDNLSHALNAGAAPRKPQLVPDLRDQSVLQKFTLNVDKGKPDPMSIGGPSLPGTEVSIQGRFDNGTLLQFYALTSKRHMHQFPVRADAQGRLWAIVGIESSFESFADAYFTKIGLRLTPGPS